MTDAPTLTRTEFDARLRQGITRLAAGVAMTAGEWLEYGRLWNTIEADPALAAEPECARFRDLLRVALPTMTAALDLTVGRGFALASAEHDFVLGGVMDPRHRYRVTPG